MNVYAQVFGGGARPALDMPAAAYHAHRTDKLISYEVARKEFTFGLTVVSSVPKVGGRVLIHELGHSVANLGEEYFDPSSAFVPVIDHPVAEVFTNPALGGIVRKYFEDVGAFEQRLEELVALMDEAVADPDPWRDALRARWPMSFMVCLMSIFFTCLQ